MSCQGEGVERQEGPRRKQNMTTLNLGTYCLTISRDNTGRPAAYVGDSSEASASGEDAILASFLQEARNAGTEDALYAAISAAKAPDAHRA